MELKNTFRDYKKAQFESKDLGDCSFLVKDDPFPIKLRAIKSILQVSSPIFDTLLRKSEDCVILIDNCNATTFQKFLNFIQWEEIDIRDVDEAFSLIELSQEYKILDLENICETLIGESCVASNACAILEKSERLNLQSLVEKALNVMKTHTKEVFASPGMLQANIDTLIRILDQDTLSIDSEMEVFEVVSRYAAYNGLTIDFVGPSEKNGTLTDVLKKVRFMAMTPEEFALRPLLSILLTIEQKNAIIGKLLLPSETSHVVPTGFSLKEARIHYNKHRKIGTTDGNKDTSANDPEVVSAAKFNVGFSLAQKELEQLKIENGITPPMYTFGSIGPQLPVKERTKIKAFRFGANNNK